MTSPNDLVATAERLARQAHRGQFRRDGRTPYVAHPEAVAAQLPDPEGKAAAWLHDVIEDTPLRPQDLLDAGIPQLVVDAIELLTKRPGLAYLDYLQALKTNPLARRVKIADMLANLADSPTERQIVKYARGLLVLHDQDAV